MYTTLPEATIISLTLNTLHLYVPQFIRSPVPHVILNENIKNSFTLSIESWTTDGKIVNTGSDYQLDARYYVKINGSKKLAAHQTEARAVFSNKTVIVSVSDHVDD